MKGKEAELWFGLYWILTQALRWNQVYRSTFKDRLSQRYEKELPGVDIFVCTADPQIEPPMMSKDQAALKKLYEEMESRIQDATRLGRISEEIKITHKGFSQWDSYSSRHDHDTILQILIDGKDPLAIDIEGCALPTLAYLAREKRPQHPHNFKAGAMNSLIRVSSKISNGPFPQNFGNVTTNEIYGGTLRIIRDVEFHVMRRTLNGEMRWV
ncbi:hypothetical protein QYF36_006932 [Acer negundo]|nr:hypothetical protein QYF36_006932 [Acer negundo]